MNPSLSSLVHDLHGEMGLADSGPADGERPRYELFHAANSICSQKVRAVLAWHGLAYRERTMRIAEGQTYLPSHVRLRMIGCGQISDTLASRHNGSTSASSSGCDAAVVPTLVDWAHDAVFVDSRRICQYLDDQADSRAKLRPLAIAAAIDAELAIVDNLPNYQMLVGRRPDGRATPTMNMGGPGFSQAKVERCCNYLKQYADDPVLVRAYSAKLDKEQDAADTLFSPESMQIAYAKAVAACATLEKKLARRTSAWLLGDTFSMADLFWAVELLRMDNLGAGEFWRNAKLPSLEEYFRTATAQPAIRAAIIDWPGAQY